MGVLRSIENELGMKKYGQYLAEFTITRTCDLYMMVIRNLIKIM